MTTMPVPMGPIELPWWFIAMLFAGWAITVALPSAVPLAVAGALLAKRLGRSPKIGGLGSFALGAVVPFAIHWTTQYAGGRPLSPDVAMPACWVPSWILTAVLLLAGWLLPGRPDGEPRAD